MAQIDIVIILIALWGAYRGWKNGLLKEVASTLGFLVGLYVAYRLYESFGDYLSPHISTNATIGQVAGRLIAFILLWVVSPIVLGFLATLATKVLGGLRLGFLNSMAGAVVGVIKYMVLLSFIFGAMSLMGILSQEKRDQSVCYTTIASVARDVFKNAKWKGKVSQPAEERPDTVWIPMHH